MISLRRLCWTNRRENSWVYVLKLLRAITITLLQCSTLHTCLAFAWSCRHGKYLLGSSFRLLYTSRSQQASSHRLSTSGPRFYSAAFALQAGVCARVPACVCAVLRLWMGHVWHACRQRCVMPSLLEIVAFSCGPPLLEIHIYIYIYIYGRLQKLLPCAYQLVHPPTPHKGDSPNLHKECRTSMHTHTRTRTRPTHTHKDTRKDTQKESAKSFRILICQRSRGKSMNPRALQECYEIQGKRGLTLHLRAGV